MSSNKYILVILGILSAFYGILVLQVGSGTLFWLIWEAIGVIFLIWAFLLHRDYFEAHPKIRNTFRVLIISAVAVLVMFCGMISSEFTAKGNHNLVHYKINN